MTTVGEHAMLRVSDLTAGYGETVVLRHVDLSIPAGRTVALLGPNGAGKSTLLATIAGAIRPMEGTVVFDGEDVTGRRADLVSNAGICYLPEGRGIFPSLTVRENVILAAPKSGVNDSLGAAVAAFPELADRMKQVAGSLSGGQQQMLALARAIVTKPKLIIVDEASLGLAPILVDRIFSFFDEIVRSGISLLLVEQYVERAIGLADFVYILNRGAIVFNGRSDEVDVQGVLRHYLGIEVSEDDVTSA